MPKWCVLTSCLCGSLPSHLRSWGGGSPFGFRWYLKIVLVPWGSGGIELSSHKHMSARLNNTIQYWGFWDCRNIYETTVTCQFEPFFRSGSGCLVTTVHFCALHFHFIRAKSFPHSVVYSLSSDVIFCSLLCCLFILIYPNGVFQQNNSPCGSKLRSGGLFIWTFENLLVPACQREIGSVDNPNIFNFLLSDIEEMCQQWGPTASKHWSLTSNNLDSTLPLLRSNRRSTTFISFRSGSAQKGTAILLSNVENRFLLVFFSLCWWFHIIWRQTEGRIIVFPWVMEAAVMSIDTFNNGPSAIWL